SDFQIDSLAPYLRMNFRIADDAGNSVAMGRNLDALRRQLGVKARVSFASLPPTQWHQDNITRWDFGDLPQRVEVNVGGVSLNGYPALVDNGTSVSMTLFDAPDAARTAM